MKRPGALTITGALWFVSGLLGVLNGVSQQHTVQPDGDMINMLIGVGLWSGWRLCRWYALFATGFAFIFSVFFLPWALWHTNELVYQFPMKLLQDQRPHDPASLLLVILVGAVFMFLSGWMFSVLKRDEVRRFFKRSPAVAV